MARVEKQQETSRPGGLNLRTIKLPPKVFDELQRLAGKKDGDRGVTVEAIGRVRPLK